MRKLIYTFMSLVILAGCNKKEITKICIPRVIKANERFNEPQNPTDSAFKVVLIRNEAALGSVPDPKKWYQIKRGDTTIRIQTNSSDTSSANGDFRDFTYINTQKTCILAQIKDNSGLTAPFYLITLKGRDVEVVQLYRPSKGLTDDNLMGLNRIGRDGYLVNQDFFVTNVNAKVYFIKRQNPAERIKGQYFLLSPDKQTLVFLMPSSELYEVNYITNDTYTTPLGVHASFKNIYDFVKNNFNWSKNSKDVYFLTPYNNDKVLDIKDFK